MNKLEKNIIEKILSSSALEINSDDIVKGSSKHWNKYNKGKTLNKEEIINFRRYGGLSYGLDDKWGLDIGPLVLNALEDMPYEFFLHVITEKNIGNDPDAIKIHDGFISGNDIYHLSWAHTLCEAIEKSSNQSIVKIFSILEIGGGFGSLSRILSSVYGKEMAYSLVELPLSAALAAYYLAMHGKTVSLNGDLISSSINGGEVVNIFTPGNEDWMSYEYDIIINTRSMMEMDKDQIDYYFNAIQNKGCIKKDGYFLNVNRYHKNTVGEDIQIAKFPYDEKWKVIISKQAFRQDRIHFLLAKRTNVLSDIHSELSKINNIGKKYKQTISLITILGNKTPTKIQPFLRKINRYVIQPFLRKINRYV